MAQSDVSLDGLVEYVRALVARNYPGRTAKSLRLDLSDGGRLALPIPAESARPTGQLPELQLDILQAVAELDGSPTATQIAAAVGATCDAHFRRALVRMRRAELLGGAVGATGYPITEAGRAAIRE